MKMLRVNLAMISKILLCCLFSFSFLASAGDLSESDKQEILDAKEAAPKHVAGNATIMVFRDGEFKKLVEGTNNFTCLVLKNPEKRYEPACFNEEAMTYIFPAYDYETRELYKGKGMPQIQKEVAEMVFKKELPEVGHGSIVYMMSQKNDWFDYVEGKMHRLPPHLMFYSPTMPAQKLGFTENFGQPLLFQIYPHMTTMVVLMEKGAEMTH